MRAAIEQLKPRYVKHLLIQGTALKSKDVPEQLVKAKSTYIKLWMEKLVQNLNLM